MRKIFTFVLALALVVALFAACTPTSEPNDGVEPIMLIPVEDDFAGSDVDYWDFVRPLGYLLDGATWHDSTGIGAERLLMWYVTYAMEFKGIELSDFEVEGLDGLRIPAEPFETAVYRYFGTSALVIISESIYNSENPLSEFSDFFDVETTTYILHAEPPIIAQTIMLHRVEEMIGEPELEITFSVTIGAETAGYILHLIRVNDDTFHFLSLTGLDGETDRAAFLSRDDAFVPLIVESDVVDDGEYEYYAYETEYEEEAEIEIE